MEKLKIEYVDINSIKPYEKNPRFNDEAVDYVAKSIKEFGFKNPIIIDENNIIIAGHTRLKASQKLGLKEVPIIKVNDLTDEQVKAFRLADNKVSEKAQWNFELLDEELNNILDINMEDFGFIEHTIDWDNVDDLTVNNYEEPSHNMLECPKCHHIDRDIHFKKVSNDESADLK